MNIVHFLIAFLTAIGAWLGVGASVVTGWLVLSQAPRQNFEGASSASPGFAAAWQVVGASGKLEFLFGRDGVRLPLDLGAEALELFREFDAREDRFLTHPDPLVRSYALFHTLAEPELPYERVAALLDDASALELAHLEVGLEHPSVGQVAMALLCRHASRHDGARLMLERVVVDDARLALRGAAKACLTAAQALGEATKGRSFDDRPAARPSWRAWLWSALTDLLTYPTVSLRRYFFQG